ncbi:MAG: phage holin family protein [Balneolales bacterium]
MKTTDDQNIIERLRKIPGEVKMLVEKRVELLALNVSDKVTDAITKTAYKIAGGLLMLIGFIFLLHTLSLFLGELLESAPLGYLIVAMVVILTGLLLYSLNPGGMVKNTKNKIREPLDEAIEDSFSHSGDPDDDTRIN